MPLWCIVSEIKRYVGRKMTVFHSPPPAFDVPVGGDSVGIFAKFVILETRKMRLQCAMTAYEPDETFLH